LKGKEIVVIQEADDSSCQCPPNSEKADNGTCVLKSNGKPSTLTCATPNFIQKGNTCKCNVEGGYNKDPLNETNCVQNTTCKYSGMTYSADFKGCICATGYVADARNEEKCVLS
jgi:hypothetical protein